MASNKMLIDASHPEETRVVMVRGNRIEEFDFESQNKRQLRGNIYLAKVTRVEPSLQAAFVDYGGNRHGFLAFSEIHPDYYQIPVADRQALLDEEAAYERSARERDDEDEEEIETSSHDDDGAGIEEKPVSKRKPRRKTRKATKEKEEANASDEVAAEGELPPADADEAPADDEAAQEPVEVTDNSDETPSTDDNLDGNDNSSQEDDGDDSKDDPKSIAAVIETDSISEPAPEDEDGSEGEPEDAAEESAPPPRRIRRKATSRPGKKKTPSGAEVEAQAQEVSAADTKVEPEQADAETKADIDSDSDADNSEDAPAKKKPAAKRPRRRSEKADAEAENPAETAEEKNGTGDDEDDDQQVESIGEADDAMEEVARPRKSRRQYKIQEVIKRRQVLLVQVVKEERGNKGAALTTYLSLAGRYSVLMPNTARGGGISRKITNANDRKRLKSIASELEVPQGMGVILRTAGASRTKPEIERDFEYLMRLWQNVRNLTLSSSAPCLVYEEGSLIKRSIRDLYDNKNTSEVLVAGEEGFMEARGFMEMLMPSHTNKVKLFHDEQSLFAKFGTDQQLEKMFTPQVTMKSGGYLVINQTEALVAIDVNSGRSTREHSVEDTAVQTNLEAAEEVARQLRLRDLAGLIVIDFIDMEEKRNNRAVEKRLKDCLKHDRARIQVGRISHFGLMEMSRQRMRASVLESTMDVCPHCGGNGFMRAPSTVALQIIRGIEEHLLRNHRFDAIVKASGEVALYILNHKRQSLLDLESRFGVKILVEASHELLGADYEISKGEAATGERTMVAHIKPDFVDADAIVSDFSEPEDEGEEKPKNNRKRRRRGKRGDSQNAEADTASETDDVSEQNGETSEASSDDEDNSKRNKRRRGKRGGRRNRQSKPENGDDTSSAAEGDDAQATAASDDEAQNEAVEANSEVEPESETSQKPKRNSRPRKRKPVVKEEAEEASSQIPTEEVEEIVQASDAVQETEKPKARRTRRTTRRVAAAAETGAEIKSEEPDQVAPEAVEPDPVEQEAPNDGKKKKSSWWTGSGFFK